MDNVGNSKHPNFDIIGYLVDDVVASPIIVIMKFPIFFFQMNEITLTVFSS